MNTNNRLPSVVYTTIRSIDKIFIFYLIFSYFNANAQYTNLYNFPDSNGTVPSGSLISDGTFLYGMTNQGGTNNSGTIFKIKSDGTGYSKLLDFVGASNGSYPNGSLFSNDTFLYGMTKKGGTNDFGTIFKIKPDGTGYSKLFDFAGGSFGYYPIGSFISDGTFLYGMTPAGGTNGMGTIFKILTDGTGYSKLLEFAGASNGREPTGSLFSDGIFLYGMTRWGGTNNLGTIFKIMPNGTGYSKLLDFAGASNGRSPTGSLIMDGTFLYGMTDFGGTNDIGTIFKIMPDGTGYSKILNFTGVSNGSNPNGSLILNGTFLYGVTTVGGTNDFGTIFKIMPNGTGYSKLFDLAIDSNGTYPIGPLISDGSFLYGMAYGGGTNGFGTIFKIMPDGTGFSKFVDFLGASKGSYPNGSLFFDGTFLYGMANKGGTYNLGTIFKMMPNGTGYSKILDFAGTSNGSNPDGNLISDGTFLYGMTKNGGTNNLGTIFKIKPDGTGYSKLVDFAGALNGNYPTGSLISDSIFLYGMTSWGGTNYYGTIFKIMTDGTGYSKLLDFAGGSSGYNPIGSLILKGSFLYGMTAGGGTNGKGTIFKIMTDGTGFSKILDFAGASNGSLPSGTLISDSTSLYGMTSQGGTNNMGTIFKIMPDGSGFSKLLNFAGASNGNLPTGSLILKGSFLYGMTYSGGINSFGILFKIMPNGTGFSILQNFGDSSDGSNPNGSLISDGTFLYGMTTYGGTYKFGTIFKYQYYFPITNTIVIVPGTCGNNNGSATVIPSGGTGSYTYAWSNGNTTSTVTGLTGQPTDTLIVTIIDSIGTTLVDTAIVNCISGINDHSATDGLQFTVYTNPTNGMLMIEAFDNWKNPSFVGKRKKYAVIITNVLGEIVYKSSFTGDQPSVIDISKEPCGIYFLHLKSENGMAIQKIIIQK